MLARIVLYVLPSQVSSVLCKWLFLDSKQITIDHWACLDSTVFEELVIMRFAWRPDLYDMAAWTAFKQKKVESFLNFKKMLDDDNAFLAWEKKLDIEIIV